jgi:hypothetical protein
MAKMLRPLHRKCWWQQPYQVSLLPLLPGPSTTYIARVTQQVLDRRVETGRDPRQVHAAFFDKRATVVDVTDKEVIDLFQDGLYHRRTFEDFGRRRPSSITKLKDFMG